MSLLLDVVFLLRIVLATQLQYFGIDEIEIKQIINEVFHNSNRIELKIKKKYTPKSRNINFCILGFMASL